MSKLYIDVRPNMYESFLSIFDLAIETGDISYYLHNYNKEKITAGEIHDILKLSNFDFFGITHKISHLVKKMNIEILNEEDNNFVVFQLAPFLGLPGKEPKKELEELKKFLSWIKDEGIIHSSEQVNLILSRTLENVKLEIVSLSPALDKELNAKMHHIINNSEVLKEWVINQKLGLLEIDKHKNELSITLNSYSLMNMDEKNYIQELKRKTKVISKKH